MQILLYVFVAYIAVCWLWGLYLAIRLYTGRRLTRLMQGSGVRERKTRPITTTGGGIRDTSQPATTRAAEALAKSRAA
ncbi:MAG: hypothetical protein R3C45_18895 [Phycisphaerales bacterium]